VQLNGLASDNIVRDTCGARDARIAVGRLPAIRYESAV
jgi:hypothetical protein